jgi:hypothetical protein
MKKRCLVKAAALEVLMWKKISENKESRKPFLSGFYF